MAAPATDPVVLRARIRLCRVPTRAPASSMTKGEHVFTRVRQLGSVLDLWKAVFPGDCAAAGVSGRVTRFGDFAGSGGSGGGALRQAAGASAGNAGGGWTPSVLRICCCLWVGSLVLVTSPALPRKVPWCRRCSSRRKLRHVSPVSCSAIRMSSSASQHS